MTLEESKEIIPMMEAMITQIEEQQNIMGITSLLSSNVIQTLPPHRQCTGYRRTADASGRKGRPDTATYRRESAMAGISTEIKQREPTIAETEQRIADIEQQIEKARDIDDRIRKLKETINWKNCYC